MPATVRTALKEEFQKCLSMEAFGGVTVASRVTTLKGKYLDGKVLT